MNKWKGALREGDMLKVKEKLSIATTLHSEHYDELLTKDSDIKCLEIISESFIGKNEEREEILEKICKKYQLIQHGLSLNIGSSDEIDFSYLRAIKKIARKIKSPWISDSLSWGRLKGSKSHDLLPIPYKKEFVKHISERARIIQDFLELPLALKNLPSYLCYSGQEMPEWEFFSQIVEKSGIYIHLDIQNLLINAKNVGCQIEQCGNAIPLKRVAQIRLKKSLRASDNDRQSEIFDQACQAYCQIYPQTKNAITIFECTNGSVPLNRLCEELQKIEQIKKNIQGVK